MCKADYEHPLPLALLLIAVYGRCGRLVHYDGNQIDWSTITFLIDLSILCSFITLGVACQLSVIIGLLT